MEVQLDNAARERKSDVWGESRAFVLLETARLRCESLMAYCGRTEHLMAIHREVGLAGYVTCADFDPERRRQCVVIAAAAFAEDAATAPGLVAERPPEISRTLATMFSETIAASDALASELAANDVDDAHRDRLHRVHAHVMCACELLDERLTLLELEGASVDAAV